MKLASTLAAAGLIFATIGVVPAAADPGRDRGDGKGHVRRAEDRGPQGDRRGNHRDRGAHLADCPPGLARKNPPCVPPGQARKRPDRHGTRVGDILRPGDHAAIGDPRRHDLESRRGWDYYRDGNSIYRVDSNTRKILAVIELIDAFSN